MKKSIAMFSLLIVLLCTTGCGKTPSSEISGTPNSSHIPVTITADRAVKMVKDIIDKESVIVAAEGYEELDGRSCHRIHAYTLSTQELIHPDTGEPYYQQFTFGWYLVDVQTGTIYDITPGKPVLIKD